MAFACNFVPPLAFSALAFSALTYELRPDE